MASGAAVREVLFVCTGNLCRSPLAAALFRKAALDLGVEIDVRSSGLLAAEGMPPPWEILQLAKEEGLDLSRHAARPMSREDFEAADLVIVMEDGQRESLRKLYGDEDEKLHLLSDFMTGRGRGRDIADPFDRSIAHYRSALEQIHEGVSGLLRHLGAPI